MKPHPPTKEQVDMEQYLDKPVAVYLHNGIKLTGVVEGVMASGFFLTRDGSTQMVFYRAISTIQHQ